MVEGVLAVNGLHGPRAETHRRALLAAALGGRPAWAA